MVHCSKEISWSDPQQVHTQVLSPGITAKTIWKADNKAKAMVVEFEPGAKWEGIDLHEPGPEEVFVLSGVFNDGNRDFREGDFIHNPAGSFHIPQSRAGCRLFLFFPEG